MKINIKILKDKNLANGSSLLKRTDIKGSDIIRRMGFLPEFTDFDGDGGEPIVLSIGEAIYTMYEAEYGRWCIGGFQQNAIDTHEIQKWFKAGRPQSYGVYLYPKPLNLRSMAMYKLDIVKKPPFSCIGTDGIIRPIEDFGFNNSTILHDTAKDIWLLMGYEDILPLKLDHVGWLRIVDYV